MKEWQERLNRSDLTRQLYNFDYFKNIRSNNKLRIIGLFCPLYSFIWFNQSDTCYVPPTHTHTGASSKQEFVRVLSLLSDLLSKLIRLVCVEHLSYCTPSRADSGEIERGVQYLCSYVLLWTVTGQADYAAPKGNKFSISNIIHIYKHRR